MKDFRQQHFSHDMNASRDDKVIEMRRKYGSSGYGMYWEIIEYLFSQGGTAKYDHKLIAMAIGEDVRKVRGFLDDCINIFYLFETDRVHFWSNRLRCEIGRIIDNSNTNRKNANKRWIVPNVKNSQYKEKEDTDGESGECNCNATALQPQCDCNAIDSIDKIDINTLAQDGVSTEEVDRENRISKKGPKQQGNSGFDEFWIAYPRKKAKAEALKAWKQLRPTVQIRSNILSAIDKQKLSRDWQKDGGQFIPYPATWLRGGCWEDEPIDLSSGSYASDKNQFVPNRAKSIFDEQEAEA